MFKIFLAFALVFSETRARLAHDVSSAQILVDCAKWSVIPMLFNFESNFDRVQERFHKF